MSIKKWKEFNESFNFDDPNYSTEEWKSPSGEVTSDAEFRDYVNKILMNAHGEEFEQEIADDTISGLLDKYGEDYGAAIGALKNGLSE